MPSSAHAWAFALTAFVIIVIPGPSVTFIVGRALAHGRRTAVLSVMGNTAGEYVQVLAIAFGVGGLVERSAAVFTTLRVIGAAYLIYLGLRALLRRHAAEAGSVGVMAPIPSRRAFWQGAVVGVTNPKTVIFLAAILPQFIDRTSGDVPAQILLLGLVFSAVALVCDSMWALVAGTARQWFARSPRRVRGISDVGGVAIVVIGIRLALTGRHD